MTVIIRTVEDSSTEYFAYAKSMRGTATYFVYFTDDIWGAVALHNFIQMLQTHFKVPRIEVTLSDKSIHLKNDRLLDLLRNDEKE
jgi:hypothetical protein|tara:strand:- start:110 stop:364 length:255 start_codon:yes stop_codon:yes gene_type:complete